MEIPLKKKLGINIPYDLATPPLDIYPEKPITEKYTCTSMFIAALFTIARTWKQPRCSVKEEWIKKLLYVHNEILLSHKMEHTGLTSNKMDESRANRFIRSDISQKEKKKIIY